MTLSKTCWRNLARILRAGLAAALLGASASSAVANGYLFFHDHALDESKGTVFTGSVTDERGQPITGAQVSLNVLAYNQSLTMDTDARGRYRSNGLDRKINPSQVKVTVLKQGYRVLRAVNMSRARQSGQPVVTDFVLIRR